MSSYKVSQIMDVGFRMLRTCGCMSAPCGSWRPLRLKHPELRRYLRPCCERVVSRRLLAGSRTQWQQQFLPVACRTDCLPHSCIANRVSGRWRLWQRAEVRGLARRLPGKARNCVRPGSCTAFPWKAGRHASSRARSRRVCCNLLLFQAPEHCLSHQKLPAQPLRPSRPL